tara:strand:- start:328 stop:624 length:297 start_codon:yes stop_codon:yes gene_type:complete
MSDLPISCPQCDYVWAVPKNKKGGQVNCPACGVLTEIKGASDTKLFYSLVLGLFAFLGLPFGVMAVIGLINANMEMAVCSGSIFIVACLVFVFSILGS